MRKRKVMVGPTWSRPPAGRPGPWGMAGGTRAGQHRRSLRVQAPSVAILAASRTLKRGRFKVRTSDGVIATYAASS